MVIIDCGDDRPKVFCICCCQSTTGRTIPAALANAPKTSTRTSAAMSGRRPNLPRPERKQSCHNCEPGTLATTPTFVCGQAWTQSRQNVQSMLPDFRG